MARNQGPVGCKYSITRSLLGVTLLQSAMVYGRRMQNVMQRPCFFVFEPIIGLWQASLAGDQARGVDQTRRRRSTNSSSCFEETARKRSRSSRRSRPFVMGGFVLFLSLDLPTMRNTCLPHLAVL